MKPTVYIVWDSRGWFYWSTPDEAKAQQLVADWAVRGLTFSYTAEDAPRDPLRVRRGAV